MIVLLLVVSRWIQAANASNDPRNEGTQYYDPCDYPRPMDGREYLQSCGSAYLGSNIFCDPDHQFSRTEADALVADLGGLNVSSCLCNDPSTVLTGSFEKCTGYRAAILFARTASVHYKRGRNPVERAPRNDVCQKLINTSTPHDGMQTDDIKKFADDVVRIWREDKTCELDLLFVIFRQWYPDASMSDVPRLIVYVGPKLERRFRKVDQPVSENPLWIPTSMRTLGYRPSDVLLGLKQAMSDVTKGNFARMTNDRDQKRSDKGYTTTTTTSFPQFILNEEASYRPVGAAISMPDWAIILFIVCILMLPFCVLVGNLVSVVPSRRMSQAAPDPMSMRWANKRWRAGFGGGFFGVRWKAQATTAGDPATVPMQTRPKPQSNNMMFRQFTKFKKPLKPVSNAPAEPKAASWSYV